MSAEVLASGSGKHADVTVTRVVTAGTFSLDGGTWDVQNNVWIIGDASEVIVIDPAHDVEQIAAALPSGTEVKAVLLTHGHDDHIREAVAAGERFGAPVYLPGEDRMLWDAVHDTAPAGTVADGDTFEVAGVRLAALSTPGHTPGSTCYLVEELGLLFSGDTLFSGGPGATGRSYSDFDTIIDSIRTRLLVLDPDIRVLTGHGDATSIGAEAPHLQEWIDRGH